MITNVNKVQEMFSRLNGNPLAVLRQLGGYYECPKDASGKRTGPLVGYAGKDEQGRQYVGEVYCDCSKLSEWPFILEHYSQVGDLGDSDFLLEDVDCLCGAPLGGLNFGAVLASALQCRYVFPEKKITALATKDQREHSELVFSRHSPRKGEVVGIVEDVCNNFSTTDKMVQMIASAGATVSCIICILNRSLTVHGYFHSKAAQADIPVLSLVRKPIGEWRQDDPAVAEDIAAGNVVWKPKLEMDRLVALMG